MDVRHDPGNVADQPSARRRRVALAGHRGDADEARRGLADPAATVRTTALGALARIGALTAADLVVAARDPEPAVRRRACEVAAASRLSASETAVVVRPLLDDSDAGVAEVAAWSLGELGERGPLPSGSVPALAALATGHTDALVREAAVASLGALGDPEGLPAILAATRDKPAVRRRAVLALAPFGGPEVDEALATASEDRDWQVREAAELLLRGTRS